MSLDPRRSLHARLVASFVLVSLATLALGIAGIGAMRTLSQKSDDVYNAGALPTDVVRNIEVAYWHSQTAAARALMPGSPPESVQVLRDEAATMEDVMIVEIETALAMPLTPEARTALEELSAVNEARLGTIGQIGAALQAGDTEQWAQLVEVLGTQEAQVDDALVTAADAARAHGKALAAEAHGTYETALRIGLVALALIVVASTAVGLLTARRVGGPLRRFVTVLDAMADGDLSARADVRGRDEVAQMSVALNRGLEAMGGVVRVVDDSAARLGAAARGLSASTGTIVTSLSDASARAEDVAGAAELVSRNVQTVSTGAHETGASMQEIAKSANEAAVVAARATERALATNKQVARLGDSSQEIGNVVNAITSIAEQTNLLALNATIEAARAGDAGKGFAVVAGEVKELAQETARATDDIARRVEAIQADTTGAVEAIAEISEVIEQINALQATIASAVEEQTATAHQMNEHVGAAAGSSTEIAASITDVAQATQRSTDSAQHVESSAGELAQMSDELQGAIRHFRLEAPA